MALHYYSINGTAWTAITTAGQSGYCWLNQPASGGGRCMIYHAVSIPETSLVSYGRPLFLSTKNNDSLPINADTTSDIYYGMMSDVDGTATIIVDVA
jgi:hypothetical protein